MLNYINIIVMFLCLVVSSKQQIHAQTKKMRITFAGDMMQHYPQVASAQTIDGKDYDYIHCFKHIESVWKSDDFTIVNLETTLSDRGFSGYPMFVSPWQLARDSKKAGVDVFVTANNHSCDGFKKGIVSTINYLDSIGIAHTGTFSDTASYNMYNPICLRKEGFKIALLNYTYGTNGVHIPKGTVVSLIDTIQIKKDIKRADNIGCTDIIAFMHWGNEYSRTPSKEQVELNEWLHNNGVNIVIGSHPHVVQMSEYRIVKGDTVGVTVYSLGNLISNQREKYTDAGVNVILELEKLPSGKTVYKMSHLPVLVTMPIIDGRVRYVLLPSTVSNPNNYLDEKFFTKSVSAVSSVK